MDVLYDFIHSGDPKRRADNNKKVRDAVLLAHQDRVTGDYNDFWAGRDLWRALDKVEAACLFAHGLNDWNVMPEHSIHPFLVLKERGVPVQLFLHQGVHGGDPPHAQMNRWFTRWLYDVENGVEDDPLCSVVRGGARRGQPTPYLDDPHRGRDRRLAEADRRRQVRRGRQRATHLCADLQAVTEEPRHASRVDFDAPRFVGVRYWRIAAVLSGRIDVRRHAGQPPVIG